MESSRKRELATNSDKGEVEGEMWRRKLAALEKHADFSFLIGPEKHSAVVCLPLILYLKS